MAKSVKKRSVRFPPDPGTLAEISFAPEAGKPFTLFGLVINESQTGCAVVMMTDLKFKKDCPCHARIGHLADTKAIVRWTKTLEKGLIKIGVEYDL
jgi:hypothetical protein